MHVCVCNHFFLVCEVYGHVLHVCHLCVKCFICTSLVCEVLHLRVKYFFAKIAHVVRVCARTIMRDIYGDLMCKLCLKSQVSFHKRATKYRVLWREMTYKEKVSYV